MPNTVSYAFCTSKKNAYVCLFSLNPACTNSFNTYAFFLDVQKAYDTVWRDGLWLKLWDLGVKGRMWRVIKKCMKYLGAHLEGEKSSLEQGVVQGCSLSPIIIIHVEGSRKS